MPRFSTARRLLLAPLVSLLVALVVTALLVTAPAADAATSRAQKIRHARHIALNQLGDPYRYGAAGPNAFDCSGLVYFSYRKAGLTHVPRTSSAQAHHARHIAKGQLRPGDFLFFYGGGGVYHVGIFLRWSHGHALMVHSPGSGDHVRRDRPWTHSWFAGTLRGS